MQDINKRITDSETRIFKAVFPNTTNHYDTLFGGTALHLMDEVAFICATRFSRKKVVTISTDQIDFKKPIPQGSIIELVSKITKVGHTSCEVGIDIYMEDMYSYTREKVVSGSFTFVAVDDNKKPTPII
ncbi:acyl-CoA thioesterase [Nonlabens dokdonensis]|uniref:Acyl-CoA thioesterase n=1 Tax=Nonlabens dokdonensis TaxID=328515 RepID=A0A1Z8B397_9FLAO|nr:acyl-CoA thioesterase [Nonlabens dokdonensis]OUS17069.1 acyl-CoA thioesterase [Nonlabens dokdonensis]